jgi:hypothetical protein
LTKKGRRVGSKKFSEVSVKELHNKVRVETVEIGESKIFLGCKPSVKFKPIK